MNTCVDCGKEIYPYSMRCKKCAAVRRWDDRGRKPKSYCAGCGKETSGWSSYCRSCANTRYWDRKGRVPQNFCIGCGKEIQRNSKRCLECYLCWLQTEEYRQGRSKRSIAIYEKKGRKPSNKCVDCGVKISCSSTRCRSCAQNHRYDRDGRKHPKYNYCIDCGKEISRGSMRCSPCGNIAKGIARIGYHHTKESKRKMSKVKKEHWASGAYDGVYKSPSQPELDIMAALDELGIEHVPQYRIETYLYDVYLPNNGILIEYDGEYWHSLPVAQRNGKIKDRLAQEAGLKLIRLQGHIDHDLTYEEIYQILKPVFHTVKVR